MLKTHLIPYFTFLALIGMNGTKSKSLLSHPQFLPAHRHLGVGRDGRPGRSVFTVHGQRLPHRVVCALCVYSRFPCKFFGLRLRLGPADKDPETKIKYNEFVWKMISGNTNKGVKGRDRKGKEGSSYVYSRPPELSPLPPPGDCEKLTSAMAHPRDGKDGYLFSSIINECYYRRD